VADSYKRCHGSAGRRRTRLAGGGAGLPDDETLSPVSEAVRALLAVLGTGERLTV
jgi:hypothetical protein